jgi:hypothetical protein
MSDTDKVIDLASRRRVHEWRPCICCRYWTHRSLIKHLGLDCDESICRLTGSVVDVGATCKSFKAAPGAFMSG